MKIEDNFLGQKEFDELQTLIMGKNFAWFYNDSIVLDLFEFPQGSLEYENKFQFTHMFYVNCLPSYHFEEMEPILEILNPISLRRIKANLLTRTSNIVENLFHVDISSVSEEKLKQMTTSIFYMNTNNGHTEFEDGTKVECVANRMVTFSSNLKHRGTSCTDEKIRVVINFNYFENI